jgi:hypothetical protein
VLGCVRSRPDRRPVLGDLAFLLATTNQPHDLALPERGTPPGPPISSTAADGVERTVIVSLRAPQALTLAFCRLEV